MNSAQFLSSIDHTDWIEDMLAESEEDVLNDTEYDDASMGDLDLDYTTQC